MIHRLVSLLSAVLLASTLVSGQEPPSPRAEHRQLAQAVGTWDATIVSFGADGKPRTSAGVLVHTIGPGGFWVIEDFSGECMGTRCTGLAALGYDPVKKAFVQSATFSMSPQLMLWTGTFDQTGKVLSMTGEVPGMDGAITRMRKVTTWASADAMTIEVFLVLPDGKELTTMTLTCVRRVGKQGATPAGRR